MLPLLVLGCAASLAFATTQANQDGRWIKNVSLAKCAETIEKSQAKGMVPTEVQIDSNGKRVRFNIFFEKPARPLEKNPICRFDLSEEDFDKRTEQAAQGKYKVHWQQEYVLKDEKYHACIWYYDKNFVPPKDLKSAKEVPKPAAKPLGKIWQANSKVPATGNGLDAYVGLEEEAIKYLKANQLPGASIACAIKGEITYQRAFGYSDILKKKALKPNQPMRVGGISRLITAIAVLQLVDRGKLKLDEKAFEILAHIKPFKPDDVDEDLMNITVLHLLQDSGGFNEAVIKFNPGIYPRTIGKAMGVEQPITNEQMISYTMSRTLPFVPGTDGQYSDFGYFLLARIIEKKTGLSYAEYVQKNIADPFKLKSLQKAHGDLARRAKNEPQYYSRGGVYFNQVTGKDLEKWVQYPDGGINLDLLDASAGWIATPTDVVNLATALQLSQADAAALRIKPLLSDAARALLVAKPDYVLAKPNGDKIEVWQGCGVSCRESRGGRTFWTSSAFGGAASGLTCFASGVSYCHLWNCATTESARTSASGFADTINKEANAAKRILLPKQ